MKMKTRKKAQGLSMNTIIIAALVLLVLVVLAIIFGTRSRAFNQGQSSCISKGGYCNKDPCGAAPTISSRGDSPDCRDKNMDYCCFDLSMGET
jgi:hypothetical protein